MPDNGFAPRVDQSETMAEPCPCDDCRFAATVRRPEMPRTVRGRSGVARPLRPSNRCRRRANYGYGLINGSWFAQHTAPAERRRVHRLPGMGRR